MSRLAAPLRMLGWLGALALVVLLAIQLWFLGWVTFWTWQNPQRTAFMARELVRLRAADPRATLQHQWVSYDRIAPALKRAVIAAEDARFLAHDGVDWEALGKAYDDNQKRGRIVHGGSTISQQLAKNLLLSPQRSLPRKAQELLITWMIEALWSKRRILEVYLNVAEWGVGVFGAEAAARHYYGIPAAQLGPEASARLAAMLPRPRYFDRNRGVPFLDERADSILRTAPQVVIP